jgi:hypothetical protein
VLLLFISNHYSLQLMDCTVDQQQIDTIEPGNAVILLCHNLLQQITFYKSAAFSRKTMTQNTKISVNYL